MKERAESVWILAKSQHSGGKGGVAPPIGEAETIYGWLQEPLLPEVTAAKGRLQEVTEQQWEVKDINIMSKFLK